MIDYRQFLAEGYDAEDKNDVLHDFATFLEERLNTVYDPKQKRYVSERLWFALGNGNGAYRDTRLTVGVKHSALKENETWRTLCFMVTDMGKLVAYLDAEDSEILDNTPVFDEDDLGKKYAEWKLGVTDEQEQAAFAGAFAVINKFFDDETLFKTNTDAIKSGYNVADKIRLDKAIASRQEQKYVNWSRYDEQQLQSLYVERKNLTQAIKILNDDFQDAIGDKNKQLQKDIAVRIFDLKKRLKDVKTDIENMETDKLEYTKQLKSHVSDASKRETRADNIKKLGLDAEDAVAFSDQELADMAHPESVKLTKTGKIRKQRAIKTGDVADSLEKEKARKAKATRDALKAELAAELAKTRKGK